MKKIFLTATFVLMGVSQAHAMPCDTGLSCTSKSGRYHLEIGLCRYENSVRLESLTIKGKEVTGAKIANAFDGNFDGQPLLIDISLPLSKGDSEDSERKLTVIVPAGASGGIIKSKYAESQPGPYATVRQEKLECSGE